MITEVSIAVIAVAFVILVIVVICLSLKFKETLSELNTTLGDIRRHLNDFSADAKTTSTNLEQVSADLNHKMEALNPLFNALANVGDFLEQKTKSYKLEAEICALKNEVEEEILEEAESTTEKQAKGLVTDLLDLAGSGFRLWKNLNKRR